MDEPDAGTQSDLVANADRKAKALVSGETLSIAGASFLVRAESIDLARGLVGLVRGFPVASHSETATFSVVERAPAPPSREPDERHDGFELWRDGDRLTLRHASGFTGRADQHQMSIGGPGDSARGIRSLFLPLVSHVLAHRDVFVLHGAAADPGPGAMLFLGASGSGKSTLAGIALTRGWSVLSDDIVALAPAGDAVEVVGVPRPPAIPAEALSAEIPGSLRVDGRGRRHLDPSVLDSEPHTLAGLVFPYRGNNADDEVELLQPIDVLHEILGSFTSASTHYLLNRFLPTAATVAEYPAFLLPVEQQGDSRFNQAGSHLDAVVTQLPLSQRSRSTSRSD